MQNLEQMLQQAVQHREAGRAKAAAELYLTILQLQPAHPDANHNLGALAMQQQQIEIALSHFKVALEVNPTNGQYWLSYIEALFRSGQTVVARQVMQQGREAGLKGDAVDALAHIIAGPTPEQVGTLIRLFNQENFQEGEALTRELTSQFPQHGIGWKLLGPMLTMQGKMNEALEPMRKAVALLPGDCDVHCNLGRLLHELGMLSEAETSLRHALELKPDFADAYNNLGNLLKAQGRTSEAEANYRHALVIRPEFVEAHNNLGVVLIDQGRFAESVASLCRALELMPDYVDAHYNLGNALAKQGLLSEADASYRRALAIRPDFVAAHYNLANNLLEHGDADAESSYRRAIELSPDFVDAHYNLGLSLETQRRWVDAAASYRRVIELKPDHADAHQCISYVNAHLSDFREVIAESDKAQQLKPDDSVNWERRLYAFSYHPDLSDEEIFKEFVRWGDRFPDPVTDFTSYDRNTQRRLRVGYVSPDFRRHSSYFYFLPLFANHDRSAFELYAYSNVKQDDDFTEEFKLQFEHWRDIRNVKDVDVAEMVRQDRIDILVDCCNHMLDDRLDVFALKPAPVQVTWLGAAWTTGLKTVDYVLFDPYMAPDGTLARESIVRLPGSFVSYMPSKDKAEIVAPPILKNGHVTFGYSGRTERLNHRVFHVWGEIMRKIPDSQLILDYPPFADGPTQEYYRHFMAEQGVDVSRVVMRKSGNIFEGLKDFDILLDSFPHSGGTMLFDALWMGVPALTLAGRPPVGRIGTSLMMNLGLPEWIAYSESEYVEKACVFARSPDVLASIRAGMRERMTNSPLMDGAGFARGVESAYKKMFTAWSEKNQ